MNAPLLLRAALCCTGVLTTLPAAEPDLSLQLHPDKIRVRWPLRSGGPDHSLTTRRWQLERSSSLSSWSPVGAPVVALPGGPRLAWMDLAPQGSSGFFRLSITDNPAFLARQNGEAMGYVTAMDERMAENGSITPQNFPALFPQGPVLPQISFDVTTAEYWSQWNTDPVAFNATLPANSPDKRLTDFRPGPAELALLQQNGFVVSEARGSYSFADMYYRVWMDDLPVYVSSDSILHAWHRTWITMLEELEELALRDRLFTLTTNLSNYMSNLGIPDEFGDNEIPPALNAGLTDARSFISTAVQLARYVGTTSPPQPSAGTWAGKAVRALDWTDETMFGSIRSVDWTQFGPRAHYENSETLKSYFRTMMWLGLTDFRIDQTATDGTLHQLAAAVVLTLSLREAGLMDEWQEMDSILTPFSGRADSLTPPQFLEILQAEGLDSFAAFTFPDKLPILLSRLQNGQAGVQQILAQPVYAPVGERKLVLPRSFTFFGQRFTPESWTLSRVVFDSIWREDAEGLPVRVRRRLPSALDINFAVLGNDTPAPLLSQRMTTSGVAFRDGYDYARELVSARQVMDSMPANAWTGSLYLHALNAMRSLSAPLPPTVPEAMRTAAWKWKTVHTQLAAWTELRHDNLLYAKQSYTPPVTCFYPAGYVEPRPAFYAAMKQLVEFAKTAVAALPLSGSYPGRPVPAGSPFPPTPVDRAARKTAWVNHFADMALTLQSLTEVAQAEVAQQPFNAVQTDFIRSLVQMTSFPYGGEIRTYTGWYPRLFLESAFKVGVDPHPSEKWDPLVADIHTDGPDAIAGDPGAVLYNSTGNVAFMLVCIDVNGQRCLHGGPSFTYYEFTKPLGEARLTDQVWKTQVRNKEQPGHPDWTSSFLVPGPITIPSGVE